MKPNISSRTEESRKWEHTSVYGLDEGPDQLQELHKYWRQQKAKRQRESNEADSKLS